MSFNSIDFMIFLPLVFLVYWFIVKNNLQVQNAFMVAASYLFYGWWDWRFLSLLALSSIVDYCVGAVLGRLEGSRRRRILLGVSLGLNLGLLGFFKYCNFFVENFRTAFTFLGHEVDPWMLKIVLPVGISFYTFQSMSYTIDVYRKRLEPAKDLLSFLAYVSFFPQLVAGPIERATNLLPQFYVRRSFDSAQAMDGAKQIAWGLFKKIVIADRSAMAANSIFSQAAEANGSTLLIGALFFSFQIYCDFSGYSDIAIGSARLFGFRLMRNFAFPYFSRDIAEFWRRWHISLSTWFRDYLYYPLGGSRGSRWQCIRNVFIIFLASGFWHGANWTFMAWGALNALYFLPLLLTSKNRNNLEIVAQGKRLPSVRESLQMMTTFLLVVVGWIFFRAENFTQAIDIIRTICSPSLLSVPLFPERKAAMVTALLIVVFVLMEWRGRDGQYAVERMGRTWPLPIKWLSAYAAVLAVYLLGYFGKQIEFIYFQF